MKKISLFLAIVMILCIPVTAFAADDDKILTDRVTFTISNGTANCYINILSDTRNTTVSVQLLQEGRCINSWSESNKDTFIMNKSVPVQKGKTYTLIVDVTVQGVAKAHIERIAKS